MIKPTINQVLFVSDASLVAMKHWPSEIRALFDPYIDWELAERITQIREEQKQRYQEFYQKYGDEIPF